MRPEVIILMLTLLGWLIGLGWCHNATCPECQTVTATVPTGGSNALAINIADRDLSFSAATTDNLLFSSGACEYSTPLSEKLQEVFTKTVQHLTENSNRILVLTGLYEVEESNNCTDAADLGIARAEQVKQLLVQMGAPEGQIELEASTMADLEEYKELKVGGVNYAFKELLQETVEATAESLRAGNITLYFNTMEQEINLDSDQRAYLDNLKAYLAQNTDAKVLVSGHTDDVGEDRTNMRLSRKRSEFVRDFMINQGIQKSQIVNKGLGPDEPIASNSTEEGRALNRRVEITLQ